MFIIMRPTAIEVMHWVAKLTVIGKWISRSAIKSTTVHAKMMVKYTIESRASRVTVGVLQYDRIL